MRLLFIAILFVLGAGVIFSCNKYKDPAATTDPRLTKPYCNDPAAVNYNWDFPGKPDNSVCFYPSDLFVGTYYLRDTVTIASSGFFISADSFFVTITRTSTTDKAKVGMRGDFCGPGSNFYLQMTATASYTANVDTTIGDTLTPHSGQQFCHIYDTINGQITRDRISDSVVFINLQVYSDTTTYTHQGRAVKQK